MSEYRVTMTVEINDDDDEEFERAIDHHIEYFVDVDNWNATVYDAHAKNITKDKNYEIVAIFDDNHAKTIEKFDSPNRMDAQIHCNMKGLEIVSLKARKIKELWLYEVRDKSKEDFECVYKHTIEWLA